MSLSRIAESIGQSATLKLNDTAAKMRQNGEPVIHLGGGEPKSKAPQDALDAAGELLKTGEIRYTPPDGTLALKKAITRFTEENYGRLVAPEQVMASSGAKQAIMVALQAILDPQDELLYPAPYWVSYPEMCKLVGAKGVAVQPTAGRFEPLFKDFESKVTPRTKAIILNSPNNPSGAVYSEDFVANVVGLCETRGLYLIMDDIYQKLIFDGHRPLNCYKYAKDLSENSKLIVINGVSKQYAMTGFRIGWAVASRKLIEVMTNIQGHQTSGPSALSQQAAVGALNGNQSSVEELRTTLESSRNTLVEKIKTLERVSLIAPRGTFYSFPDFSAYEKSSVKLAQFILEKVKVVTVPGIEFGMEGHLRISYCGAVRDVVEGIERIRWALDAGAPKELRMGDNLLVRDWA